MGGSPQIDYLIVGAGVFGVSTALHLAKTQPAARIVLVDRDECPSPSAASSDLNKIIRADYGDPFYMRLALEAVEKWRHDDLYQPWYHQDGMLYGEDLHMGRKCLQNYKALGVNTGAVMLTPDEARSKFPCFEDANWTGVSENYFNPGSGWADADGAMRAVAEAAVAAGVEFVRASVATVQFSAAGDCAGVQTDSGQTIEAARTLLCTGARTAQLLADSAPDRADVQVGGRMVAAAAAACIVRCEPAHRARYRGAPVHFLGMAHTRGESVPLNGDGRLKFNLELSFTHAQRHAASGQLLSAPPPQPSQSTWSHDVPRELQAALRRVVRHVYGAHAPGLHVEAFRMCWDAVTPNQDFVVAPHPAVPRLYVAGGGSFHGWKFLPVIGRYVAAMLRGELDAEHARRWAWDRADDGAACAMYIPKKDLSDFQDDVDEQ